MCWWMPRNKVIGAIFLEATLKGSGKKYVLSNWNFFPGEFSFIQRDEGLEEFSSYPLGSFLPFVVTAGMQIKSFQKADCRTAT
jgi:hypothetical protein